jgi:Ca2+-binding EF-hand superfamily protein
MDASLRRSDVYSGINEIEYAKAVARKMFENYDSNQNNNIDSHEITPMMQDVYRGVNNSYSPSKSDIDGYSRVLDTNRDGKVTLADLEALCIKYLVSASTLSQRTTSPNKYGESIKKSALPVSYLSQSPDRSYDAYNAYNAPNARSYNVSPYKGETEKRSGAPIWNDVSRDPFSGEVLKRSGITGEGLYRSPQETNRKVDEILSKSSIYIQKTKFSQIRRVFDKFDEDKNGFIDERELKLLMEETYRILGLKKVITSFDIQSYLSLVDTNRDGLISYPEYENIVTKALAKINIKLE